MKKQDTALIVLLAVWVVGSLVFAFTDLQISQSIFNPNATWVHLFEAYGQIPGALVAFLCGSLLMRLYVVEKKLKSIVGYIGFAIVTLIASIIGLMDSFGAQIGSHLNIPIILITALVLVVLVQIIFHRVPTEKLVHFKNVAKVGLTLLFVAGIASVWAFKIPWGRWTYRDIIKAGDLSLFSPWYIPQGNNGHNSFFSGHAAMIFCVLPIVLFFKKDTLSRKIALMLVLAWGIIGATSRVVIGAHFASDVLFGSCETILWFLLFSKWYKVDL